MCFIHFLQSNVYAYGLFTLKDYVCNEKTNLFIINIAWVSNVTQSSLCTETCEWFMNIICLMNTIANTLLL